MTEKEEQTFLKNVQMLINIIKKEYPGHYWYQKSLSRPDWTIVCNYYNEYDYKEKFKNHTTMSFINLIAKDIKLKRLLSN